MTDSNWQALSLQLLTGAAVLYAVALAAHSWQWAGWLSSQPSERRVAMAGRLGLVLSMMAAVLHGAGWVARGMAASPNRVPWGNMYEFTIGGTLALVVTYLWVRRTRDVEWLAPLVTGLALVLLMLAQVQLFSEVSPLMEALESRWLVIHVLAAIVATGVFVVGGLVAAAYLVKDRWDNRFTRRLPDPKTLDRMSFQLHAFAFPVWTFAVLIAGPIWAREAWGSYWNWDAKEVWAFITWVVYAAYLHARSTAGWRGRRAAWLALVGVATVLFNFIGVNYFVGNTQHGYAATQVGSAGGSSSDA